MFEKPLFRRLVLLVWVCSVAETIHVSLLPRIELPVNFWNADKFYHLVTYAWLGALPLFVFVSRKRAQAAAYAMIGLGVLLEWAQASIPGRSASFLDALANAVGVFCGVRMALALLTRLRPAPNEGDEGTVSLTRPF